MSRFNHHHKLKVKDYANRLLLCVTTITVLVLSMPNNSYTTHHYQLGEPWEESPVIAKDSFPVYKPENILQAERDSLKRYYEPYFQLNAATLERQQKALTQAFRESLHEFVPDYYLTRLQEKLKTIYEQGVMEIEDYDQLRESQVRNIWVYRQNESSSRPLGKLFTPKSAYEFLSTDADSVRFQHAKLQRCNLTRFIQSNLAYDIDKSQQQRQEVDNMLIPYMGQVQVGQKIVDRGQIVDEYTYNVLLSMERYQQGRAKSTAERLTLLGGQVFYVTLMVLLLYLYFLQFRNDYLDRGRMGIFVLCMFIIFPLITYTLVKHQLMSVYVIPYCVLPIFLRIFMDSRTAFITHTLTILTCAIALRHPFEFVLTQVVAGLVAIYSLRQLSQRSELFRSAAAVTLAALGTYLCIDALQGNFFTTDGVDRWTYIYLCIAGILSLISYLLLIPIERIFGFTSTVTLVELSNINNEVLRRLSEEAPGTFQHSMQVANLAAEVANRLGAKSQLVRTGALYHDIGKIQNAVFFTENQSGTNPHDELTYEQSAQIIIQHVQNGLKLAVKYKLPAAIREFIQTHHGRSMVRYFYVSFKNQYPDKEIDKSLFSYPGPNPTTQEQAILMMADAVEAASRSLSEYTEDSINAMVDKIIDAQVSEGYFKECPITFLDIADAKEVFKDKLKTIYHTRIQYPELK
ncbi:MAG: HDIG domain-containing protein [Bacteroidaceae bacterium]|nr:HDIG domain-containing protein [Bacteroidaceae bacterium]